MNKRSTQRRLHRLPKDLDWRDEYPDYLSPLEQILEVMASQDPIFDLARFARTKFWGP